VNHRTAPVEVRERLSIGDRELAAFGATLREIPGVGGAAVLSTCNRVEATISASSEEILDAVVSRLVENSGVTRTLLENHLYILRSEDVVRHLIRVAAGLDSMVIGEPQIAGQLRAAYLAAQQASLIDPLLHRVFDHVLHVAKRIRTETGIGEHAISVPFAAVELARKIFGDLSGLQILLLGAGEMGELTAQHLQGSGLRKIFVANRAYDRASALAKQFGGEALHFDALESVLSTTDIVIASTAAPHYILTREKVESILSERRRRDLFLIDLAVPRNLDPEIGNVDGVYLYNIDALQEVVDSNRERRMKKADEAELIVEREVLLFAKRLASDDAIPTIVELQARLDEIRRSELERCLRRLGPITAEQQQAIEGLTTSIINKILHYPILRLKESAAEETKQHQTVKETIRKIFGLR
jgi:glutamyl-tRNA reductase